MQTSRASEAELKRIRRRDDRQTLTEITDLLISASDDADLTLGALLKTFGKRGLGVLLILPAILIILPIGIVPLFPAAAGIAMIVIAGHMLFRLERLWVPARLAALRLPGKVIRRALQRMRPASVWIDRRMEGRFARFARSDFATDTVAVVTILLSILIIVLGIIPGLPSSLAGAILIFALGLTVRNGFLILLGYVATLGLIGLILWILL